MATVNTKLIVPEIYAELVREKIKGKARIAQFADNLGNLINKEVGETISFPVWSYIGDASDIVPGTAMTSAQLEQKQSTATIKMVAAPGVKVYDYDDEVALGRATDEAAQQQATAIARKLDSDLIAEATKTAFKKQTADAGAITEDEVLDAFGLFGDDRDTADFAAIVAHSAYAKSFYKMDGFNKTDITYSSADNGKNVINGVIGSYMGIPVILSDRLYNTSDQEGYALVIKKHSLGYMPKEEPFVEAARDASTRSTTMFASQIYAVKLTDEAGIVMLKHTVSAAA